MKSYELYFSFKGARQYIQGPDIFNESNRRLQEQFNGVLERVEFVIHRMTGSNLILIVEEQGKCPQPVGKVVAEFRFETDGNNCEAHLLEMNSRPEVRNSYDESAITDLCQIKLQERYIELAHGEAPHSPMETLVSMNKALHLNVFPDLLGSWVFCRWSSPSWPLSEKLNGVRIQMIQALGTRLTRSEVTLGGKLLGYIYFSARSNK